MFSSTPSAAHREARHELDNLMEEAGDVVFRLDTDGMRYPGFNGESLPRGAGDF